jgi:hypothetical protein
VNLLGKNTSGIRQMTKFYLVIAVISENSNGGDYENSDGNVTEL